MRLLVLGSPEDLELAGRTSGGRAEGPRLALALRDPSLLDGVEASRRVVWLADAAPAVAAEGLPLVAQKGAGLWRRAPWPAADELFDLDPPEPDAGFLIAGATAERRERLVEQLTARGYEGRATERLTLADLRAAAAVALLGEQPGGPLAATAPAVAAARRLLVTDAFDPNFGFQPNLDFLPARDDADIIEALDAALTAPGAFDAMRTLAAHAARAHRASEVYARLLADADLEGVARNSSSASST